MLSWLAISMRYQANMPVFHGKKTDRILSGWSLI